MDVIVVRVIKIQHLEGFRLVVRVDQSHAILDFRFVIDRRDVNNDFARVEGVKERP